MPFKTFHCPKCSNEINVKKVVSVSNKKKYYYLSCGHFVENLERQPEDIISTDGRTLFDYQCEGVRFIKSANAKCLIGDEMRLGKTVQVLAYLNINRHNLPVVIVTKSTILHQWQLEIARFVDEDEFAQIITTSKEMPFPGCKFFIISYDLLRRFKNENGNKENRLVKIFEKIGVKTLVLDECQAIKNGGSQRTSSIRELASICPNIIALSGTPIKNHAGEYFPILNLLRPDIFNSEARFITSFCSKVGNLMTLRNSNYFHNITKDFIIRRTREEVMPSMPSIFRSYEYRELSSIVAEAYEKLLEEFDEAYDNNYGNSGFEMYILAYLVKMRHLTGLSKINPCVEYLENFIEETGRKITVFVHHLDVAQILIRKLKAKGFNVVEINSALKPEEKADIANKFTKGDAQILVASTLSTGEGLTLYPCTDCIMLERQWNPANEEQAESRFPHVTAKEGTKINACYIVAIGTIDEFFAELVEKKRAILAKTLDNKDIKWDQTSLIKELAERLRFSNRKKWTISPENDMDIKNRVKAKDFEPLEQKLFDFK